MSTREKIKNPATGRLVFADGSVGKKIKNKNIVEKEVDQEMSHQMLTPALTAPAQNLSLSDLYNHGHNQLTLEQKSVVQECFEKKNGGVSLSMGSGKSILSIVLALKFLSQDHPKPQEPQRTLIIVPKSLVGSWIFEIQKFFDNKLQYQIISSIDEDFKPIDVPIYITTSDVLVKCYKYNKIEKLFEDTTGRSLNYKIVDKPFLNTNNSNKLTFFHDKTFTCMFVDEVQKYTNAKTKKCKAIATVCASHRFLLSGTIFNEPKPERILGYHLMLNDKHFPRNLPDTVDLITDYNFKGLSKSLITRKPTEHKFKIRKHIVQHTLTYEEEIIYLSLKDTLDVLRTYCENAKEIQDVEGVRTFSAYILTLIVYMRQSLVSPIIPYANISLDILDYNNKSDLSFVLNENFERLGLDEWLNASDSAKSSRIKKVIEVCNKHKNENIVMFSSFRTSIDLLIYYLKLENSHDILTLTSKMTIEQRTNVIKTFTTENQRKKIIILSYDLGAEGHNLQNASVVMLVDFWWNAGTTNQAIARIARSGQKAAEVNVYLFTSNTGMEKALFAKQQEKLTVLDELFNGPQKSKVSKMSIDELLKLIDVSEAVELLSKMK